MKKGTKNLLILLCLWLVACVIIRYTSTVQAEDSYIGVENLDRYNVIYREPISDYIYADDTSDMSNLSSMLESRIWIGGYRHQKENVIKWESVSYYPMSHELTAPSGGSITVTESKTFGTTVSGTIDGLGLSLSKSITTATGYTATVAPNRTARVSVAVYYQNERGLNLKTRNGKFISRNSYHIKTPYKYRFFLEYMR